MKRLAGDVRQYSVFTSTPPLAPVATAGMYIRDHVTKLNLVT